MAPGGNRFGKQRPVSDFHSVCGTAGKQNFVGGKTEAVGEVREAIRAVRRGKNLGHSSARTEEENQKDQALNRRKENPELEAGRRQLEAVLLWFFIAVKGRYDHGNSYKGKCFLSCFY